jgi:hypothetical protein
MKTFLAPLVRQTIVELQNYQCSPASTPWPDAWFANLRSRLEHALVQDETQQFERELHAVYRSLNDSGPTASEAAPSLAQAIDALQRQAKRVGNARQ